MILGPDTQVPESRCPHCKEKLDGAFEVGSNGRPPAPGSVSLCISCGNWMVFGPDLRLVRPSSKMLAEIKKNRRCQIAYHAVMKVLRNRARKN